MKTKDIEEGKIYAFTTERKSSHHFRGDAACLLVELMSERGRGRTRVSIKPEHRFKGARPQDILMLWSDWEKQEADQAKRLKKLGIKEGEGFDVSYDDKITLRPDGLVRLLDLAEKGDE